MLQERLGTKKGGHDQLDKAARLTGHGPLTGGGIRAPAGRLRTWKRLAEKKMH